MGRPIVYCQVCGERILEADFTSGKALSVAGQNLCPRCRPEAPPPAPAPAPRKAPLPAPLRETRSIPTATSRNRTPLVLGGVAGAVVLVIIVAIALPGGKNSNNKEETPPHNKPATERKGAPPATDPKTVFESLKAFAEEHRGEPAVVIARVREELHKLDGTPYSADAQRLIQVAQSLADASARVDEFLKSAADAEKSDPGFALHSQIFGWLDQAREEAKSVPALVSRVDQARRAYERRFGDAVDAAARELLQKADELQRDERFDDAIAVLDRFPAAFAGTDAAREIDRHKEEFRKKKAALEKSRITILGEFQRAVAMIESGASATSWDSAAPVLEQVLADLGDGEKVRKQNIGWRERRDAIRRSHFLLACHRACYKKEIDPAFQQIESALRLGWEDYETLAASPYLESVRADSRYASMVDKWKKLNATPARVVGFRANTLTEQECFDRNFPDGRGGFAVLEVTRGSAGERAGLKSNDVVVGLGGTRLGRIDPVGSLWHFLHTVAPNQDYDLEILREGKAMTLKIRWDK